MRLFFALLILLSVSLFAQQPPAVAPGKQVITFKFRNANMKPADYDFQLEDSCATKYDSGDSEEEKREAEERAVQAAKDSAKKEDDEDSDTAKAGPREEVKKEFTLSPALCHEIFDLAVSLHYFDGDFQFKKHKVANTGDRWLGYFAPGISHRTAFTYSDNPQVQRVAAIFEGISTTIQTEATLRHLRRYDRLGLNQQLATVENQVKSGWLLELSLLRPLLEELANDPQLMNIARQRAQRILRAASAPSTVTLPGKK